MKRLLLISLLILPLLASAQQGDSIPAKDSSAVVLTKPVEEIYVVVDKMPTFIGGDIRTFQRWIQQNIRFPAEAVSRGISGNVIANFVVDANGKVKDITILKSPDKSLSDEVVRLLSSSPKWEAGKIGEKSVSVLRTIPIAFAN